MNKKIAGIVTITLFMFYAPIASAQLPRGLQNLSDGFIRIANTGQITDTVSVWGDVGRSGRYIIPEGTSLTQLISYSRGFTPLRGRESDINWAKEVIQVKISHYNKDHQKVRSKLFSYKYEDPIPAGMFQYDLKDDDIITLQVTRKPSFGDYVKVIAPVVGILATSILLIQNLQN